MQVDQRESEGEDGAPCKSTLSIKINFKQGQVLKICYESVNPKQGYNHSVRENASVKVLCEISSLVNCLLLIRVKVKNSGPVYS